MNEKDFLIPDGILFSKSFIPYKTLDAVISHHNWGKKLSESCRFGQMKPSFLPEVEWADLLGVHGNNLHHNFAAREETFNLIRGVFDKPHANYFMNAYARAHPKELALLGVGISLHDVAEVYIGDYPSGTKPPEIKGLEYSYLRKMGGNLLSGLLPRKEAESLANQSVDLLQNTNHPLTKMFKDAEVFTHTQAAITAWENSQKETGETADRLKWLGSKVSANHMDELIRLSTYYPSIEKALRLRKTIYDQIFHDIPDWAIRFYNEETEQTKVFETFEKAARLWKGFSDPLGREKPLPEIVYLKGSRALIASQASLF